MFLREKQIHNQIIYDKGKKLHQKEGGGEGWDLNPLIPPPPPPSGSTRVSRLSHGYVRYMYERKL